MTQYKLSEFYEVVEIIKVKKKIWSEHAQQFEDTLHYVLIVPYRYEQKYVNAMVNQFGNPIPNITWWKTPNGFVMTEKTYLMYLLLTN